MPGFIAYSASFLASMPRGKRKKRLKTLGRRHKGTHPGRPSDFAERERLKYHENKAAKAAEEALKRLIADSAPAKGKVNREQRYRKRKDAPPPPQPAVLLALPPPPAGGTGGGAGDDHASDDDDDDDQAGGPGNDHAGADDEEEDAELMALHRTAYGPVLGCDNSPSCIAAATAALKELWVRLGIRFPLEIFEGDSVDALLARQDASFTAIVNGFDGSSKSRPSELKLFYRNLLIHSSCGCLISSWASPENLGRMLQGTLEKQGSNNKPGCGMGVFEVAPDRLADLTQAVLDDLKAQLIVELRLSDTQKGEFEVKIFDLAYFPNTHRQRFLHFSFKGGISGQSTILFNLWMNLEQCLARVPFSSWPTRNLSGAVQFAAFKEEIKSVKQVLSNNKKNATSKAGGGGAAYGSCTPQVMATVISIVYTVFGFKSSDSAVDPGLGAGTTALFWICARRRLSEDNLGDVHVHKKRRSERVRGGK